jgi:SAM-dependent MidA family methyltransferase
VSADTLTLGQRLARQIEAGGPISIAHYMAEANAHYYAGRDPLGVAGDFTTAPEISQMFGELIGLCLADVWLRSGQSAAAAFYVELGPGRGTLAADALRAMQSAALAPPVHFIETSPALRERQRAAVPQAAFHDDLDGLPTNGPILAVANEFFDALPVRQVVRAAAGWRERVLIPGAGEPGESFMPIAGYRQMDSAIPEALRDAPLGSILETSPASATVAFDLAGRIARQGGAAIIIDYGYEGPAIGDTLQAVRSHRMTDPFTQVGDSDLTTHVDFGTLGNVARQAGLRVAGPVGQGAFLRALGIDARAASLAAHAPERAAEIEAARHRLVDDREMGTLFRAMALCHPDWAMPEGFGAM